MTRSQDRWVYPTEGEDPRAYDDIDRLAADVEGRQISHPQQTQDKQGLSSDQPGIDVSSHRDAVEHAETGGTYAEDAAAKQRAEDPGAKQDAELTDE